MQAMRAASLFLLCSHFGCVNIAGICGDDVTHEVRSPDGRWVATSYVRNCGATTGYATHVVLRDASQPFHSWQHDGPPDQGLVYVEEQRPELELVWQSPSDVAVRVTGEGGRVFRRDTAWHGVSITYPH